MHLKEGKRERQDGNGKIGRERGERQDGNGKRGTARGERQEGNGKGSSRWSSGGGAPPHPILAGKHFIFCWNLSILFWILYKMTFAKKQSGHRDYLRKSYVALGRRKTRWEKKVFSTKNKISRRELKKGRHAMNCHGELEFRGFGNSI